MDTDKIRENALKAKAWEKILIMAREWRLEKKLTEKSRRLLSYALEIGFCAGEIMELEKNPTEKSRRLLSCAMEIGMHAGEVMEKERTATTTTEQGQGATKSYTIELSAQRAALVEQAAQEWIGGPIAPELWIELAIIGELQKGEKNAESEKQ